MRKLGLILGLLLCARVAHATASTFVQAAAGGTGNSQTPAISTSMNVTVGDILIAFGINQAGTLAPTSMSGSNGCSGSWTQTNVLNIWYTTIASTSSCTVTFHFSTNTGAGAIIIAEYTPTAGIDGNVPVNSGSGTAATGPATATVAGDTYATFDEVNLAASTVVGTGGATARSSGQIMNLFDQTFAGSGSNTITATVTSGTWATWVVMLKPTVVVHPVIRKKTGMVGHSQ